MPLFVTLFICMVIFYRSRGKYHYKFVKCFSVYSDALHYIYYRINNCKTWRAFFIFIIYYIFLNLLLYFNYIFITCSFLNFNPIWYTFLQIFYINLIIEILFKSCCINVLRNHLKNVMHDPRENRCINRI